MTAYPEFESGEECERFAPIVEAEDGRVLVRTCDSVGQPKVAPFNLVVAC